MGKFSDYFRRKADGEQSENSYGDEYGYYEDEHGEAYTGRLRDYATRTAPQQSQPAPQPQPQQNATDTTRAMQNFMVYEPRNADDVQTLIDFLKRKESAIINLDNVEPEISQRVLDFVVAQFTPLTVAFIEYRAIFSCFLPRALVSPGW